MTSTMDDLGTRPETTPIPFGRLLQVEWRKSLDTPAARWLIIVAAVATLASMAFAVALPGNEAVPVTTFLAATSFGLGLLLPIVPLMAVSSEWGQRTATITFTQEPRRLRVLGAKLVAGLLVGAAGTVLGAAMAVGAGLVAGAALDEIEWNRVIGYILSVLISAVMGTAYGALLQNTPGAIVAMIAPSLAMGLVGDAGFLGEARNWVDHSEAFYAILNGQWQGRVAPIAVALAIWVLVPLILGVWRWTRRPVV